MRPIGFSSGALAKGDFQRGLDLQILETRITAVELSALRADELDPLVKASSRIDVSRFAYVSFHAPSKLVDMTEADGVAMLAQLPGTWPVVVHPDIITDFDLWATLGNRLCLENMDLRKRIGRTVDELEGVFKLLPMAGFCFDIGHARQIDPTMGVAIEMLRRFGSRLRQIHLSEVGTFGEHRAIGYLAHMAYQRVVRFVPSETPVILESIVSAAEMDRELDLAFKLFAA